MSHAGLTSGDLRSAGSASGHTQGSPQATRRVLLGSRRVRTQGSAQVSRTHTKRKATHTCGLFALWTAGFALKCAQATLLCAIIIKMSGSCVVATAGFAQTTARCCEGRGARDEARREGRRQPGEHSKRREQNLPRVVPEHAFGLSCELVVTLLGSHSRRHARPGSQGGRGQRASRLRLEEHIFPRGCRPAAARAEGNSVPAGFA